MIVSRTPPDNILERICKPGFNSDFWFFLNTSYQAGTKEGILFPVKVGKITIESETVTYLVRVIWHDDGAEII